RPENSTTEAGKFLLPIHGTLRIGISHKRPTRNRRRKNPSWLFIRAAKITEASCLFCRTGILPGAPSQAGSLSYAQIARFVWEMRFNSPLMSEPEVSKAFSAEFDRLQ